MFYLPTPTTSYPKLRMNLRMNQNPSWKEQKLKRRLIQKWMIHQQTTLKTNLTISILKASPKSKKLNNNLIRNRQKKAIFLSQLCCRLQRSQSARRSLIMQRLSFCSPPSEKLSWLMLMEARLEVICVDQASSTKKIDSKIQRSLSLAKTRNRS